MTVNDLEFSVFWDDDPELWDTVYLAGLALPGVASVTGGHGRKLDVKSAPGRNGARIVDKGYEPAKVEIALRMWTKEQLLAWYRVAPTLTFRREPPAASRPNASSRSKAEAARAARATLLAESTELEVREAIASELDSVGATTAEIETKTAAQLAQLAAARGSSTRTQRARRLERHDVEIGHPALDTIGVHRVYIDEVSVPVKVASGVYEVKIKAIESRPPTASSSRAVTASTAGQSFATGIQTAFDAQPPSSNGGSAP